MLEKFDKQYLRIAQIWAENSYAKRLKVGAIIVKDKMIISDGFNGSISGFENNCEDENGKTFPYVLHAEANAISKIAQSNNSSKDSTLYIYNGLTLYGMFKAYNPGRNQKGCLFG